MHLSTVSARHLSGCEFLPLQISTTIREFKDSEGSVMPFVASLKSYRRHQNIMSDDENLNGCNALEAVILID